MQLPAEGMHATAAAEERSVMLVSASSAATCQPWPCKLNLTYSTPWPCNCALQVLRRFCRLVEVDEWNTSKLCCRCHQALEEVTAQRLTSAQLPATAVHSQMSLADRQVGLGAQPRPANGTCNPLQMLS